MVWTETSVMDSRMSFIAACERADETMASLCARYGISRKTGYKWLDRYHDAGVSGLFDRSRSRHTQSYRLTPLTASAVLGLREQHPTWGPRKLRVRLQTDDPETAWPAASTLGDLLRREGVSAPRARRRQGAPAAAPILLDPWAANVSWSADFKGWFRVGDGVRCEPLTVSDGYSRYLLCCQAVPRVTFEVVRPLLSRVFEEYGLPGALRTDNGNPFARRGGLGGLTRLSVWLLKLDVWPDRIAPRRPDMNGRHERMHRVLREDTVSPAAAGLVLQQRRFDDWRVVYNTRRPHEALGQRCPAALYTPSARRLPAQIAAWEYPADHHTRKVIGDGHIVWRDREIYLSAALRGETVGLAQRDPGDWVVRFRGFDLAIVDEAGGALKPQALSRTASPAEAVTPAD
jgi:putative transposase